MESKKARTIMRQPDVPIVDAGKLIGVVSRGDIMRELIKARH